MGCGAGQARVPEASRVYVAPAPHKTGGSRLHDGPGEDLRGPAVPIPLPWPSSSCGDAPDTATLVQLLRGSGMQACRRLGAELQELNAAKPSRNAGSGGGSMSSSASPGVIAAGPRTSDALLEWDAQLHGPSGSPYEGGVFRLAMWFPEEYPFKPPRVQFVTPCFHPNISERGQVCLNVLKEEWSPMLTVSSLLMCIQSLLCDPNPQDPLNTQAADLLASRPVQYRAEAQAWTRRYAMKGISAVSHAHGHGAHGRMMQAADANDLSADPLATYQTVQGRTVSEAAAMRQALYASRNAS
mmetsp:Transcript_51482/g.122433  ORF Transcript_51482/g.122433 Transcript_51482/m.122433 type:complete len:298 (+) Transcript_51482:35-928(+)